MENLLYFFYPLQGVFIGILMLLEAKICAFKEPLFNFLAFLFLIKGGAASGLYYTSWDYQININQHGRIS